MPTKPSFSFPPGTFARTKHYIAIILWTLYLNDGEVKAINGHGLSALRKAAVKHGMSLEAVSGPTLTTVLQELDHGKYGFAVQRETRAASRSLYGIKLMIPGSLLPPDPRPPAEPEPEVNEELPTTEPLEQALPEPEPMDHSPGIPLALDLGLDEVPSTNGSNGTPPAVTTDTVPFMVAPAPPIDALLHIQSLAAGALIALSQMAGYVAPDQGAAADSVQAERLAETLEENQRLRLKNKDLAETVRAKTQENNGLRRSVLQLQANLDTIRNGGQVNHGALRALREREKLMAEVPKVKA